MALATTPTVYALDRLKAKPGRGQEVLKYYMEKYVPRAQARGMVLDRVMVSPALWLEDESNTLHITWAMGGAGGFYSTIRTAGGRFDAAILEFWEGLDELVEERTREFLAPASDIAELCNV